MQLGDDRLRGFVVARGRISGFHFDLRRRPYNTLAVPCECVIYKRLITTIITQKKLTQIQALHSTHSDSLNR